MGWSVVQSPHPPFVVEAEPVGNHPRRLHKCVKRLIAPAFPFEHAMLKFDVRIFVRDGMGNALMAHLHPGSAPSRWIPLGSGNGPCLESAPRAQPKAVTILGPQRTHPPRSTACRVIPNRPESFAGPVEHSFIIISPE